MRSVTGRYRETDECNEFNLFKIRGLFPSDFCTSFCVNLSYNLADPDLLILIIFNQQYKLLSSPVFYLYLIIIYYLLIICNYLCMFLFYV